MIKKIIDDIYAIGYLVYKLLKFWKNEKKKKRLQNKKLQDPLEEISDKEL